MDAQQQAQQAQSLGAASFLQPPGGLPGQAAYSFQRGPAAMGGFMQQPRGTAQQQQPPLNGSGVGLTRAQYMHGLPHHHHQGGDLNGFGLQQQEGGQSQHMVNAVLAGKGVGLASFDQAAVGPPGEHGGFPSLSTSPGASLGTAAAPPQPQGTTPFDASDFPSLVSQSLGSSGAGAGAAEAGAMAGRGGAGRGLGGLQGGLGGMGLGAGSMGVGVNDAYSLQFGMLRHKHGGNQNGEFSIQNEEFPALGGSAGGAGAEGGKGQDLGSQFLQPYGQIGMPPPPLQTKDSQAASSLDALGGLKGAAAAAAPPATSDGSLRRSSALGLLGGDQDVGYRPDDAGAGHRPHHLGPNLNLLQPAQSFASPWSDASSGLLGTAPQAAAPQPQEKDPNFTVPQCYLQQVPLLQPGSIKSFPLETLFYMFYSTGERGEEGSRVQGANGSQGGTNNFQSLAADELWSRGWCFHREHKLWLARVPNTEPVVKTDQYERGSFLVFDSMAWDIVRKDNFVLQYSLAKTS